MSPPAELPQNSPRAGANSSFWNFLSQHRIEIALFLCVWFAYGVTVNSRNQYEFNLQHAGIEAIVERHHFYLEGSPTPRLQMQVYYYDGGKPFGDVFEHHGHQYAAKQPGQFMLGAIVYAFLHLFGLNYVHHYALTAALVSFLTTSLVTGLAAVAVFATVKELAADEQIFWPLASATLFGLGTTAFVYAGIAYHDAIASGYLVIAFYGAVLLVRRRVSGRSAQLLAALCGLLLGFTVTTSMLPFFMACLVGFYVVSLRRWGLVIPLFLGGLFGIAPLLIFNSVSFGNPFLNSYTVGGYPESMLHLDLHNSIEKIRRYLSEITLYVPIVWVGLFGLVLFPKVLRWPQLMIVLLLAAQAMHVVNIESHGGCHYGPRFLLPAMPFTCIGLAGFAFWKSSVSKWLAASAAVLIGLISIFISAMGALFTAMYCDVGLYALWPALANLKLLALREFPLAIWLVVPLLLSVGFLVSSIRNRRATVGQNRLR